ncbi:toll-like receptor 3 isoform X4 [Seriola dumerili]|uniref:toll-like receptor 3 isoform X4 n=1 Tax=Seriola dumerili TaxID=41447 RepID=UPI000BBE7D85|nr:toll-like receptor 3 isoform X4 [Seriola dumerili]
MQRQRLVSEAMRSPRSLLLTWVIVICYFMTGPYHCMASQKKTSCSVQDGRADCSHLSLNATPQNLPRNITSLDMSHNRLVGISPESLSPYNGLLHLDVSYNSITKLDVRLCQTLPQLQTLIIEHNEVHLLKKDDLSHCTSLTRLNMASNRLKLQGEPFSSLKNLQFLDVSTNKLPSAKLSSQPQLPSLVNLNLAFNDFSTLEKDDFSFLNHSPFLRVLNLSTLPLKKLEPGCLDPISGLHTLIMDGSNMDSQVISKLCLELSGTSIETLSLQKDRDGVPGMPLLESIVDNMKMSRKILFVVTESLLKDPWCRRFKAHHALNEVIEASRDSVVLVFLQDVHDYKLSRSLFLRRGMLRSRCILDWHCHKERVPAFHQKLLIALGMTNRLKE